MGNLKMREVRLNNGVVMPSIGFGVYQIPKNDTKRCVLDALEVGYRMIDTAASYFNEKEVGEAVRESGLPRESVFVTSKLWVQDYEYDDALKAAEKSLDELGLEYIDLYLLHKPYGNYYAAWRALESLYSRTATITPLGGLSSLFTSKVEFAPSASRAFLMNGFKTCTFTIRSSLRSIRLKRIRFVSSKNQMLF